MSEDHSALSARYPGGATGTRPRSTPSESVTLRHCLGSASAAEPAVLPRTQVIGALSGMTLHRAW